jgi:DNA-binding IclR family transcriptional regulator
MFYFKQEDDTSIYIRFAITHKDYVDDIQPEYDTVAKTITASIRLAVRDGDGYVID